MRSRPTSWFHAKFAAAPSDPRLADNRPSIAKGRSAALTAISAWRVGTWVHAPRTSVAQASAKPANLEGEITWTRLASFRAQPADDAYFE